jgi:tetratricopeptide (TPR) repeat protein
MPKDKKMSQEIRVTREEFDGFKKRVIETIDIIMAALDNYATQSQATQQSVANLSEAIEGLIALQESNVEKFKENNELIRKIRSSLQPVEQETNLKMDLRVSETDDTHATLKQMHSQLRELQKAQRQQVEELLQRAVRLRHPRHMYASPDQDLQRQVMEFRTQMDLIQQVILERHTGVASPAENRRYGEIYLRRGVIAYHDNDMPKSREVLRIAERFFSSSEQEIESMPRDQRLSSAFTQFYLALIEKNYGLMTAAREYIERSYVVYGRNEPEELLTPTTRAEILSYLGDMDDAQAAITEVLDRADNLRQRGSLLRHNAIYALRARLMLGNTYYVRWEWQEALKHYQDTLEADERRDYSYYTYYSIAQVHHKLGNDEEAKENKRRAYKELDDTGHLQTKVALDTRILLNALAYLCTREDEPEKAREYKETVQELWLRIREVNGLQLRLFSFEKKQPVSKDEFWVEVFSE